MKKINWWVFSHVGKLVVIYVSLASLVSLVTLEKVKKKLGVSLESVWSKFEVGLE